MCTRFAEVFRRDLFWGPRFFSLFINDFPSILTFPTNIALYGDDINVILTSDTLSSLFARAELYTLKQTNGLLEIIYYLMLIRPNVFYFGTIKDIKLTALFSTEKLTLKLFFLSS